MNPAEEPSDPTASDATADAAGSRDVEQAESAPPDSEISPRGEPESTEDESRASLSSGLQFLFGGRGAAPSGAVANAGDEGVIAGSSARTLRSEAGGGPEGAAPLGESSGPGAAEWTSGSPFLHAWESEGPGGVLPFGVEALDDVLGGGLDRGLTVFGGEPAAGKTLLLEEALRSALDRGWSVYYAAYREGTLAAWERLMARESRRDEGLPLPLTALRGRSLDADSLERLRALDARFRADVGLRLVLVDRLPAGRDGFRALLDNVWWRLREAREAGRPGPLVLIDDLQTLEMLIDQAPPAGGGTGGASGEGSSSERLARLVAGLDREFGRLGLPAVATAAPRHTGPESTPSPEPWLRAGSYLRLTPAPEVMGSGARIEVAVEKNGRTGWHGRLQLNLDRRLGLLA